MRESEELQRTLRLAEVREKRRWKLVELPDDFVDAWKAIDNGRRLSSARIMREAVLLMQRRLEHFLLSVDGWEDALAELEFAKDEFRHFSEQRANQGSSPGADAPMGGGNWEDA